MVDILAVGAHPDDIEFGCGGILAKMAAQKKSIVMVDLTLGDKASNGTPSIREKEGIESAKLIGAERIFLNDFFSDCEIIDSYEGRLLLTEVIRTYRPRLILAPMWKGEQTHPDHTACGLMMRYACRYARFKNLLPSLEPHTPDGILHYLYPTSEAFDFIIDVSEQITLWKQMMECHKSQMLTTNYVDRVLRLASNIGLYIDKPYAQALIKGNPIEIDDLMTISKATREI